MRIQVFTQRIGEAVLGTHAVSRDLLLGSAWLINLAIAEWVIRGSSRSPQGALP